MLRKLFHRLRASLRRGKIERQIDAEMRFHLEMETAENIRRGMSEEEARRAALLSFGGVERVKEAYRDLSRFRRLEEFWQDLRYGARMLRKNPGFTVVAILTLALGIGANTAIFSVVNVILLKPVPYYDPQRVVWVTLSVNGDDNGHAAAQPYLNWQAESKSFEHLVAFISASINWTGGGEPQRLSSVWVTANTFSELGVAPLLGRAFTPEEDRPGGERVALLSHAFWTRSFGGDPDIIGQSLKLDGQSRTVIGIMPPEFRFLRDGGFLGEIDVWAPLAIDVERELKANGSNIVNVIGRLKPGFTPEQAQAELTLILRRIYPKLPPGVVLQARVTPLSEMLVGNLRRGTLTLFGAVGFVLLIACANVANLLLGRAAMRQKEMAVRAAMGAGRGRLVRQMLTESLLLSMLGGGIGLLLATLGVKALVASVPDTLAHLRLSGLDSATLGFTFLATLLTGVAAGVIPALQTSRINLNETLKEGSRNVAALRSRSGRISPTLVIGELALTLALLAGAGLLIKSFLRLLAVAPGYDPKNLLTMMAPLDNAKYPPGSEQMRAFYREALTRIKVVPGVEAVATASGLPLTGWSGGVFLNIEGRELPPGWKQPVVEVSEVSPDYFRVMGMRLIAGRGFTDQDDENSPRVIVINETLASRHFGGEYPIGKRILFGSLNNKVAHTIIGVVSDVKRYGLESEVLPEIYEPYPQAPGFPGIMKLTVRTTGDPLNLVAAARRQIWAVDADQPIINVMTMTQRLAESVAPRRFQTLLFGVFAAVALMLAAVGVYGVISHSVSRRTHEIGVRMALGARPRNVLLMVIRQGMTLALVGVAIGLAASLALTRVMSSLLFNVKATDPATFTGISLLLAGAAFLAAYLPARRATKIDPMVALRHD
jgi:putative ABC transport system permease protein